MVINLYKFHTLFQYKGIKIHWNSKIMAKEYDIFDSIMKYFRTFARKLHNYHYLCAIIE